MSNNTTTTSSDLVVFDFSDPWVVASTILFSMLVLVALYRTTRICCECKIEEK